MTTDTPTRSATVEELASLGSGASFWSSKSVGQVPAFVMSDGPHGVRRQLASHDHLGLEASEPATCFPPGAGIAQTWDPRLVEQMGNALGDEARVLGVDVLLGPGINIKRDPRCGRNFEYYSEDPFLAGVLGAAWVRGVQDRGVGAALKHFAANNAEYDRMRSSSDLDDRTAREVYLRAFQRVVQESHPWTIMCSYNRINGVPAAHNHWLLTTVLRDEWGFDGAVISDWSAVVDRVRSVAAGLDLVMPGPDSDGDEAVVRAVQSGELDLTEVQRAARRVATIARRAARSRTHPVKVDYEKHHALAREVAGRSIVLLKNEDDLLPLSSAAPVAVIGAFATVPRFQGGGSSHVRPTRLDIALEEIRATCSEAVTWAEGYSLDGSGDGEARRKHAATVAARAETAVVFLGLSDSQESEGYDRDHIDLPSEQLDLLKAVLAVQPRTVVVLTHGGVVRLSHTVVEAPAILDGALLGQGGGAAIAEVLFGSINPSGRLAETVPIRLQDVPSYLSFPGSLGHVRYAEGLFVGYRWYDARELEVSFPFGHGLSYTTFNYHDLQVTAGDQGLVVRVQITNTGERSGRETVQVYSSLPSSAVERPVRELKGFAGVWLQPGETEEVRVEIPRIDLSYWDTRIDKWLVEGGEYVISVGASSRDLRTEAVVAVAGDAPRMPLTLESTFGEVLAHPIAGPLITTAMQHFPLPGGTQALGMDLARLAAHIPVGRLSLGDPTESALRRRQLLLLLAAANDETTL